MGQMVLASANWIVQVNLATLVISFLYPHTGLNTKTILPRKNFVNNHVASFKGLKVVLSVVFCSHVFNSDLFFWLQFLSMRLAAVNPRIDFNLDSILPPDVSFHINLIIFFNFFF